TVATAADPVLPKLLSTRRGYCRCREKGDGRHVRAEMLALLMIAAPPLYAAEPAATPLTAIEERALKSKDSFRECDVCPEMVVVPAGSFLMGSPKSEVDHNEAEDPLHRVTIARPFAVGKYEVTLQNGTPASRRAGASTIPKRALGALVTEGGAAAASL